MFSSNDNIQPELPTVLTVDEMAKVLKIGRAKAYQMTKVAGFPTKKLGRALRIPTKALLYWLNNQ